MNVTYGALDNDPQTTLPQDFALHLVYPNPFNPSAAISFDIPIVETRLIASLQVYDIKGRLVETLLKERLKPGSYSYTWFPFEIPSGVYFLKLKTEDKEFTQKATYVK